MFGDNHKISHIQMSRQYQLVFFAPLLLFVSKELKGGMGILAVGIIMPLVWLILVCLKRCQSVAQNAGSGQRKLGVKVIVFIFQIFLVVAGVFVVAQASRLVTEYMVQGASRWLVVVLFVLVSLAVGHQPEIRGRFAEIAWPVLGGIVGVFFFFAFWQGFQLLASGNVDLSQMRSGFWNFSWRELWKNVIVLLICMAGSCLFPFIDICKEKEETKNSFLFGMVLKLSLWLIAIILLQYIYFGAKGADALNYPILDLMSGVKLPGNFVRRLDLVFLAVMMFALLFTMGSICFYSGHLWEKVNVSMGRLPAVALIFALVLTLSGCQIVEPEKRAYPLVLGIDWADGEYAIYLAMAKMADSTGQEKSGSEQEANMVILKGKDSKEIQKMYDASEELYLDVGHVQALVLGDALLQDEERAFSILMDMEQNHDLGNSPYVFQTEDMEGLFEMNGKQVESLGDYLTGLYENRIEKRVPKTLMDVYREIHNEGRMIKVPRLEVSEEEVELVEG